mmetsp:Transcript_56548/g.66089  ORF Transcript_56548/g.66089 Transcript_56548/m.66089 type:complete len:234 (-) Transcript_56548:259-960(-)
MFDWPFESKDKCEVLVTDGSAFVWIGKCSIVSFVETTLFPHVVLVARSKYSSPIMTELSCALLPRLNPWLFTLDPMLDLSQFLESSYNLISLVPDETFGDRSKIILGDVAKIGMRIPFGKFPDGEDVSVVAFTGEASASALLCVSSFRNETSIIRLESLHSSSLQSLKRNKPDLRSNLNFSIISPVSRISGNIVSRFKNILCSETDEDPEVRKEPREDEESPVIADPDPRRGL